MPSTLASKIQRFHNSHQNHTSDTVAEITTQEILSELSELNGSQSRELLIELNAVLLSEPARQANQNLLQRIGHPPDVVAALNVGFISSLMVIGLQLYFANFASNDRSVFSMIVLLTFFMPLLINVIRYGIWQLQVNNDQIYLNETQHIESLQQLIFKYIRYTQQSAILKQLNASQSGHSEPTQTIQNTELRNFCMQQGFFRSGNELTKIIQGRQSRSDLEQMQQALRLFQQEWISEINTARNVALLQQPAPELMPIAKLLYLGFALMMLFVSRIQKIDLLALPPGMIGEIVGALLTGPALLAVGYRDYKNWQRQRQADADPNFNATKTENSTRLQRTKDLSTFVELQLELNSSAVVHAARL